MANGRYRRARVLEPGGLDGVLTPVCAFSPTANVYTLFLGKLGKMEECAKLTRKDPQGPATTRKDPQLFLERKFDRILISSRQGR